MHVLSSRSHNCSREWFVMGIYYRGICRGFGAAYIPFKLKQGDKELASVNVVTDTGASVPFSLHYHQDSEIATIAVPLLSCKGLRIFVAGADKFDAFLSFGAIKWISRLNYKINPSFTARFRNIESDSYFGKIHIRCNVAVEAFEKNEIILKGVICSPKIDSLKRVYVTDGDSEVLENYPVYLGKPSQIKYQGFYRYESSFSLRIPKGDKTFCLVASGDNLQGSGFLSLDPAAVKYMLDSRSPAFYKSTYIDSYVHLARMRKRSLSFLRSQDVPTIQKGVKFSIIVPLFNTPVSFFWDMVNSVEEQVYENWELILVNASPNNAALSDELARLSDSRVKVVPLTENKGIAENTNAGIEAASGDYIVFFDHDDTLDRFALYRYAERISIHPETDALYCDEDFLNEDGEYVDPHYKSDLNLDLLRVHNYITHLLCVRVSFVKDLMLRKSFDGAQDYDFLLRLCERTKNIFHVREVLYHWRISDSSTAKSAGNKNYADEAGKRALQEHLDRCGLNAVAELTDTPCFYHVSYAIKDEPLVSIVIPNKDSVEVLRRCIDSIESKTSYSSYEILIIENNSVEKETFEYYDSVCATFDNVRVATWEGPFNYSAINNYGVGMTNGEYLLFLNNDTEVIEPNWLSSMLGFCQRDDVGAVGAKLLYPDNTVQHAGVLMIYCNSENEMGGPIHVFNNIDRDDPGYMRRAVISQDLSAVTAACMMTKRSIFEQLGGFNESFEVAFNDVDYCLRVRSLDQLVVFDADALLYHYESFSRGYETGAKRARFMREQGKLRTAWADYYVNGDPYHCPMSTR